MNAFKNDTVISIDGSRTHLIIGAGHLKRIAPIACHNCQREITAGMEVVTRRRGRAVTYKVYCGACAKRLALV